MATVRRRRRGRAKQGGPSKSEFVRQRPNLSAAQIVEQAKGAGFAISPQLVYYVRSRTGATKRGKTRSGKPNASQFVRSMPLEMPAKEVVNAAKRKGIKLSRTLVYVVRNQQATRDGAGTPRHART